MATRYQQEKFRNQEYLQQLAHTKPYLWLHRPLWEHQENHTAEPCPCCGSPHAIRIADEPYLDLLVSRGTGERLPFDPNDPDDPALPFLEDAQRFDIPFRCHAEQRKVAKAAPKIFLVSGGVGAGKSAVGSDAIADEVLRYGGPGVEIWWVAPELKHLKIAIDKLFEGTFNGADQRFEPPIFPPEFVVSRPDNPNQKNLVATLLDGTQIYLWHASNAGQFKGRSPRLVILDEGAEIRDAEIIGQLRDRVMRTNGRILIPTTPRIPCPVKEFRDNGTRLDEWDHSDFASIVFHEFTSFDNPWIPNEYINNNLKLQLRGDKTRIRREIHGEWIGDGTQLWSTFDPKRHLRGGQWERVEDLGLRNVTKFATRKIFRRAPDNLQYFAGQDFNLDPMSTEILSVAVPPGLDEADPKNWIYVFVDEVVEPNDILTHCTTLETRGYKGLHIICDATGAQHKNWTGHSLKKGSTFASEMERRGFVCKPCNLSTNGNPDNPPIRDCVQILKLLMYDTVTDSNGQEWPRVLAHTRCIELIKGWEGQEDTGDGTPKKTPNSASDRLSGPPDAARYGVWAIASPHEYRRAIKWS